MTNAPPLSNARSRSESDMCRRRSYRKICGGAPAQSGVQDKMVVLPASVLISDRALILLH